MTQQDPKISTNYHSPATGKSRGDELWIQHQGPSKDYSNTFTALLGNKQKNLSLSFHIFSSAEAGSRSTVPQVTWGHQGQFNWAQNRTTDIRGLRGLLTSFPSGFTCIITHIKYYFLLLQLRKLRQREVKCLVLRYGILFIHVNSEASSQGSETSSKRHLQDGNRKSESNWNCTVFSFLQGFWGTLIFKSKGQR